MNKNDVYLVAIILGIVVLLFLGLKLNEKKNVTKALVYYDNELVLTIDLLTDEKEYVVDGYNGPVSIYAGNGKIKVEEEDSPLHLCSKQGYISKSYESIVCLPNKIVITLDNNELDTVVK